MNVKNKILVIILFLPILAISQECTTYNDIENSTYKQEILDASDRDWITCREESSPFNPTANTSRIEALKMVLLAGGHNPSDTTEQCFDDVATDSWQNKYACYGKNSGLLTDNDTFRPNEDVNFAEASKMIFKSMTNESYEESDPWYQKYIDKMALYKFEYDATYTIKRDYFVYILTEIEADPNKQAEIIEEVEEEPMEEEPVVEEETPTDDVIVDDNSTVEDNNVTDAIVENNETVVIDDNATVENNDTIVEDSNTSEIIDDNRLVSGLSYMFTPYRCFGTTPPNLDLKTLSDTVDSANNRVMELEFDLSGGTQSCIDEYGESHNLEIFTQWWAKDANFEDLTASGSDIRYKHIRVTIPNDKENEVYLEIITSLGSRVDSQITIEVNGGSVEVKTTYGLNGIEVKDPNILAKIKSVISELESIKLEVSALAPKIRTIQTDDDLRKKFDALKKRLDDAKKLLDDVKQVIDNSDEDNKALKKEVDNIKKAIDGVKKLIDGYKKDADNSAEAIADINSEIDGVIAMMRSGEGTEQEIDRTYTIDVSKGRSTVSGNIDITKLSDKIHSVWMVDNANWYGYSPQESTRDLIKAKYRLISSDIKAYKGLLVFAYDDTTIEIINDDKSDARQEYNKGLSIHGANSQDFEASEIICKNPSQLLASIKLNGDIPSVYAPDIEVEDLETFMHIYQNDGYFVYCDKE